MEFPPFTDPGTANDCIESKLSTIRICSSVEFKIFFLKTIFGITKNKKKL